LQVLIGVATAFQVLASVIDAILDNVVYN
jgi:hypothetical protein